MNGAVQGEAIATASTPDRKALATGCRASSVATPRRQEARRTRTRPPGSAPISVNSAASAATTAGDCSWKPQPSCSPAARSASISAAQRQERQHHAGGVGQRRPCGGRARSSAWRVKPTTLIASTGNTQGMRLRIRPPSSAPSSAATKPIEAPGAAAGAAALLRSAASSAGDTAGRRGRGCGQVPSTLSFGAPALAVAVGQHHRHHRRGWRCAGATAARCAVQAAPFQAWVHWRRRSRSPRRSRGRTPASCRAARPAGPARVTSQRVAVDARRAAGLTPAGSTGLGCAANAASKAAPCSAVRAAHRQLERELAFLGDAFLAADQPAGLELDLQVAAPAARA